HDSPPEGAGPLTPSCRPTEIVPFRGSPTSLGKEPRNATYEVAALLARAVLPGCSAFIDLLHQGGGPGHHLPGSVRCIGLYGTASRCGLPRRDPVEFVPIRARPDPRSG